MIKDSKIYIIIPTHNRYKILFECINSIQKQIYQNFQVIIVDDSCDDISFDIFSLKTLDKVKIIRGTGNLWWAKSINLGVKNALKAGAKIILLLNDDLVLHEQYLCEMIYAHRLQPNAIIGSLCLSLENEPRLLFAGVESHNYITAKSRVRGNINQPYDYSMKGLLDSVYLPGRGLLIPSYVFEKIGFFDSLNFPQYAADYDFTLRAKKGYIPLLINTNAIVYNRQNLTGWARNDRTQSIKSFMISFIKFKSSNYLPILLKFKFRHHPIKIFFPAYFCCSVLRIFGGYLKRKIYVSQNQ